MRFPFSVLALAASSCLFGQLPLKQDPKDVVAVVDGREVTRGEVQQILYVGGPEIANLFQQKPELALFQWFLTQHLGKEGEAMKLDQQSPLKEQIAAMRMRYLADQRLNDEMNGFQPKREAVEKYYAANQSRYQRVRVSGIFVKYKPGDVTGTTTADLSAAVQQLLSGGQLQRTEAEARTLAADLSKRLRAGEEMAKLVQQYSEDPASNTKGGDLGYVTPTANLPQEIKTAALTMSKGSVSDPVRLSTGFYVLRCDEKDVQPLNDAAADIETELRKLHLDEYMKALNDRFRPVIKDPALMLTQPGAPQR